eukprot:5970692-Amphidinium_carterae.1
MATIEQIQELVTRIQAMEVREAESERREHALQGQVQNLTAQCSAYDCPTSRGFSAGRWYFNHRRGHRRHKSFGKARNIRRNRSKVARLSR